MCAEGQRLPTPEQPLRAPPVVHSRESTQHPTCVQAISEEQTHVWVMTTRPRKCLRTREGTHRSAQACPQTHVFLCSNQVGIIYKPLIQSRCRKDTQNMPLLLFLTRLSITWTRPPAPRLVVFLRKLPLYSHTDLFFGCQAGERVPAHRSPQLSLTLTVEPHLF